MCACVCVCMCACVCVCVYTLKCFPLSESWVLLSGSPRSILVQSKFIKYLHTHSVFIFLLYFFFLQSTFSLLPRILLHFYKLFWSLQFSFFFLFHFFSISFCVYLSSYSCSGVCSNCQQQLNSDIDQEAYQQVLKLVSLCVCVLFIICISVLKVHLGYLNLFDL